MNTYIIREKEYKKSSRIAIIEVRITKEGNIEVISHTKQHPYGVSYLITSNGCNCLGYEHYHNCKHMKIARHYIKSLENKHKIKVF